MSNDRPFVVLNGLTSGNTVTVEGGSLVLSPGIGVNANASLGTAGQVLASNGTSVYWSTTAGPQGVQGATGPTGPQGAQGDPGLLNTFNSPDEFNMIFTNGGFEPFWQAGYNIYELANYLDLPVGLGPFSPTPMPIPPQGAMLAYHTSAETLENGRYYPKYTNNGPTILRQFAIDSASSFNISGAMNLPGGGITINNDIFGIDNDILFYIAYGDDAVPANPSGDSTGAATSIATSTTNTVNIRYGYIVNPLSNGDITGLSTAALYVFYYIRGADSTSPIALSATASGSTGVPTCPALNVPQPGCLILGIGVLDDDTGSGPETYTSTNGYRLLLTYEYGSAGAGGVILSQFKASFETGSDTPPSFGLGVGADDAWTALTIAIKPTNISLPEPIPSGGTTGQVLSKVDGTNYNVQWTTAGGSLTTNIVTANSVTAVNNNRYVLANTTLTSVTLPASVTLGDTVYVVVANDLTTNIINRNGQNIMGVAENLDLDVADISIGLVYTNATLGWRII